MTCFYNPICDEERVVKESMYSIVLESKSRISVFTIMEPVKGDSTHVYIGCKQQVNTLGVLIIQQIGCIDHIDYVIQHIDRSSKIRDILTREQRVISIIYIYS